MRRHTGSYVSGTRSERHPQRVRLGGRVSVLQRSSPPGLHRVSAGPTRCPMRGESFRRAPNSSAQRGPSDCSPQLWPEPRANADIRDRLRRPRAGRLRMSRAECHVLTAPLADGLVRRDRDEEAAPLVAARDGREEQVRRPLLEELRQAVAALGMGARRSRGRPRRPRHSPRTTPPGAPRATTTDAPEPSRRRAHVEKRADFA